MAIALGFLLSSFSALGGQGFVSGVWAVQWEQGAGWQEWPLGYLATASGALRWLPNLALPGL